MSDTIDIDRIRAKVAEVEAALAGLRSLLPAPLVSPPPTEEPRWMKVPEYARARRMSPRTVRTRIVEGMPSVGSGHARRIKVADADAWLERRV